MTTKLKLLMALADAWTLGADGFGLVRRCVCRAHDWTLWQRAQAVSRANVLWDAWARSQPRLWRVTEGKTYPNYNKALNALHKRHGLRGLRSVESSGVGERFFNAGRCVAEIVPEVTGFDAWEEAVGDWNQRYDGAPVSPDDDELPCLHDFPHRLYLAPDLAAQADGKRGAIRNSHGGAKGSVIPTEGAR